MSMLKSRFLAAILVLAALVLSPQPGSAADKKVAIANLGPHSVLKLVIDGFKAGLESGGFKEGAGVEYIYKDANFDPSLVAQVLTALEASEPDLLLTITTPITQASKRVIRNKSLPIVFAPVTDPVDAGLVKSWDKGARVSSAPPIFRTWTRSSRRRRRSWARCRPWGSCSTRVTRTTG